MFSLFNKKTGGKKRSPQEVGQAGEKIAAEFVREQGYTVVTRNYRKRFGEIDIIAEDAGTLVFIEVKTRRTSEFGSPLEAVDAHKQQRMARAAQDFLSSTGQHDRSARFDVVAVVLQRDSAPQIEHIRNAFDLA